ncbi:hypothetical protein [Paraburkholderia bryophila]|uniref:Uncharacterized protein n=1 Tax=Paraburkholderia bryophila TaxID=420952 RepID=A0A7Y9W4M6_9BURK|nr:hypothetical protein [Paraburkholderia bryophila]NYH13448.1 hypothetical protein [Paraburkholderia bryophila]
MKTKTKTFRGFEAENVVSNVLTFPLPGTSSSTHSIEARQRAVRENLASLTCSVDSITPVAYALAAVYPDGTVEFSTQGIERDFATPVAESLDRLSAVLRFHAARPRFKDRAQRGIARLAPVASLAFVAATYFNEIAWLDCVLMIAGQLTVNWLLRRGDPAHSR